ncbi:universal stress protein [Marixanthomonas spongiae]|uniref:Universal stress protein n=1 Tax=Marixanthomonas spongiae TaxID=2174845 RepID=A0A2U0HWF0_9FLAO|nr:universal stress protein [Marixanthomonas spongiae]PVW13201.1 universal stress protein [Marixanthomonas spongiae]
MKRILIAIDYHPTSEQVAETGYNLAKKLKAKVCLLHVMAQTRYYGMEYPSFLGYEGYNFPVNMQMDSEIQKVAEDYLQKAAAHLDNKVETKLKKGETATAVLKYADEWKADLIVMGTHSHSFLEKLLMGTEATTVLEKTEVPVLMVPVKK